MVDADYTEPRAIAPGSTKSKAVRRYLEIPLVILALFAGAAFLTTRLPIATQTHRVFCGNDRV